jgi:hypothetical protein
MPNPLPKPLRPAVFPRGKKIATSLPCALLLLLLFCSGRAGAVENLSNGTFNTTAPTGTDISHWASGWPTGAGSGWNYVGQVNAASGIYLGNGWVLTAGHVGSGNLVLDGVTYTIIGSTTQGISNQYGTADLTLFQVQSPPSLAALKVATSAPQPLSDTNAGSAVAMIGFGGGARSWGLNTVTDATFLVQVNSFISVDFETAYGTTTSSPLGTNSATNNYAVVTGDSGGVDFIFNSSTSKWELAGMNEATDASSNSYFVELSFYASQISSITSAASAPGLNTLAASSITQTSATLNGLINAENHSTTVSFDYGPTAGYGTNVAGTPATVTGTSPVSVSTTITGLSPGTTYHFRVNGVNSVGTSNGADVTFTTQPTALQSFRQTWYGTTSNSGDAADTADPHNTGVSNLEVFAFFGASQDPAQTPIIQLPQPQLSGGNLFYSFTQPSGVTGITYGAQWSATLQSGDWHAISDTGSGSQHLFSVPAGANSKLFIRLTVSDP